MLHGSWLGRLSRLLGSLLAVALLLGAWPHTVTQAQTPQAPTPTFSWVHITDTHIGPANATRRTQAVLAEIRALPERPAFLVHGGDITEFGRAAEYAAWQQMSQGWTVYATPGNHESRWADAGKGMFRERFGQPYRSFDYAGVQFILLDTSVNTSAYGHTDKAVLDWLEAELARIGTARPVFIISHHPPAYDVEEWMLFHDNDQDLLDVLAGYNIAGVFTGHGHVHLKWERNGIPFYMTKAASEDGYKVIQVQGGQAYVWDHVVGEPARLVDTRPLTPRARAAWADVRPANDVALGSGTTSVTVSGTLVNTAIKPERVRVRLNRGDWQEMQLTGPDTYSAELDLTGVSPGLHRITLKASLRDPQDFHAVYPDEYKIHVTATRLLWLAGASGPRLAWDLPVGGAIQHSPTLAAGRLFFGAGDGKLYAVAASSGALLWTYETGQAIHGSPVATDNTVYVTSTAGTVSALDAATGQLRWQHRAGASIIGAPLLADDKVIVGTVQGQLQALAADSGRLIWSLPLDGAIHTAPGYGNGLVFVGSWDGMLRAVDALSGELVWAQRLTSNAYFSPGNSPPLYWQGLVYAVTSADSNAGNVGLWALDAATGAVRWTSRRGAGYSTPRIVNGDLVIHELSGSNVVGFDPLTGEERWVVNSGRQSFNSAPVGFGRELVLGSLAGQLIGIDPLHRHVAWRYQFGDQFLLASPLAVTAADAPEAMAPGAAGMVFAASMDGTLYALRHSPPPAPSWHSRYSDVGGHWAAGDIIALERSGIVRAAGDGEFRPDVAVTRAEVAAMTAAYLGLSGPGEQFATQLQDIAAHWSAAAVAALEERGIILGSPGEAGLVFRPDETLTRAEAATILSRLLGLSRGSDPPRLQAGAVHFADLAGHWSEPWIASLSGRHVIRGYPEDGTFRPDRTLTRAEMASLLARLQRGR